MDSLLLEVVSSNIDLGKHLSRLFLDFDKAFDTINHNYLLDKLFNEGFRRLIYKWLMSYLMNRRQVVNLNSISKNCNTRGYDLSPITHLYGLLFWDS